MAPCEAGRGVRLRADDPVLTARPGTKDETNWDYLTPPAETGKLHRDMTREEINENWEDVSVAKVKKITGPYELGCFKRWPKHRSDNIIDVKWVVTWKRIEGNVGIKCKLTIKNFKDKSQDLDTYARTTSRSGQRLINAAAAESPDVILVSFGVSQTFAKRKTFEELSALKSQDMRKVEFDAPETDIDCLKQLQNVKDYDPAKEALTMLKPIYGLKDAPGAWRKTLHQVLVQWMSCRHPLPY